MIISWNRTSEDASDEPPTKIPAAQYVRMSTEHQKYSTDNQVAAILTYATKRGFEIVRTYADEGKSGLNLSGRTALIQLIDDIEKQNATFSAILVYDVSRWGRFQDPDEAAAIELRCKTAGIRVHYCAEQFENDGSIGSSIIKTVKRAMAAEYSRELSVKVFAGQSNLIRRGYRQGGPAGFGLRRLLVDESGRPKTELKKGEHKSLAADRIILVPGPESEILIVREIYNLFLNQNKNEHDIAQGLNARGIQTDRSVLWSRGTVHQILINEKYIGNNVWARTSSKLKQPRKRNRVDDWIRADGVFEGIVDKSSFYRAQQLIAARSEHLTDEQMLESLAALFSEQRFLSGLIIDESERCPSSSAFSSRFGSLLRAYALVGFVPDRDYRYLEINRQLRQMYPTLLDNVIAGIGSAGGTVTRDPQTDLLTVNDEFSTSLVIARCFQTLAGSSRWKIRLDTALKPDLTVVLRMAPTNVRVQDYYLLPLLGMEEATFRLCEFNGLTLDAYRFDDLDVLYSMAARSPILEAA